MTTTWTEISSTDEVVTLLREPNGMTVEELDAYYGPAYEQGLYG